MVHLLILLAGLIYLLVSERTIKKSELSVRQCMPRWMPATMTVCSVIVLFIPLKLIAALTVGGYSFIDALFAAFEGINVVN